MGSDVTVAQPFPFCAALIYPKHSQFLLTFCSIPKFNCAAYEVGLALKSASRRLGHQWNHQNIEGTKH